jgi:hypothetical protein
MPFMDYTDRSPTYTKIRILDLVDSV